MGARSAEALARRAAKRGRTIEEERAAERKKEKDKEKTKKDSQPPSKQPEATAQDGEEPNSKRVRAVGIDVWKAHDLEVVQNAGKLKRDEKAGWVCTALKVDNTRCGFINFPHRASCFQCSTQRFGAPSKQIKDQADNQTVAKARRQEKVSDPSRAWAGTANVSTEKLEENKRLREQLAKDPDSLSPEERQRAEALVERDARKRAKKEEIRNLKGASKAQHMTMKSGSRDHRRREVVAGKGPPTGS